MIVRQRHGLTLVECMVVMAVVGVLATLASASIFSARESARRASCANNLRNIGLSFSMFEQSFGAYPSNGWGWNWLGDSNRQRGIEQPGSWAFAILPYLEQTEAYHRSGTEDGKRSLIETSLPLYHCPSRRPAILYPTSDSTPKIVNYHQEFNATSRMDYAVNSGDIILHTHRGPLSEDVTIIQKHVWPDMSAATGFSFLRSSLRQSEILDGVSHTIAVGEKAVHVNHYADGGSLGDDQSPFVGDDADNRRWCAEPPISDYRYSSIQLFGSPHNSGCMFGFIDGSTRLLSFDIDKSTFRNLGNRGNGQAVTAY